MGFDCETFRDTDIRHSEGLGHDSEKTTQIYLDSFENNVLDAANEMVTDI